MGNDLDWIWLQSQSQMNGREIIRLRHRKRLLFVNKKKQKNFVNFIKSFLLLFSKKMLPFFSATD